MRIETSQIAILLNKYVYGYFFGGAISFALIYSAISDHNLTALKFLPIGLLLLLYGIKLRRISMDGFSIQDKKGSLTIKRIYPLYINILIVLIISSRGWFFTIFWPNKDDALDLLERHKKKNLASN